jgi:hypothetical protein
MRSPISFIPIATTLVALAFTGILLGRWRQRGGTHHLWWAVGTLTYAAGTITESATTLFGWDPTVFRLWYISGALLGGAPLAQGSVYLHLPRRWANALSAALVTVVTVASVCALLSPLRTELVETYHLTGKVFAWQWVRAFSPFVNFYAFVFLVGGAVKSAVYYRRRAETRNRFLGNVYIAIGAMLPGIGGTFTRFGYTEVLYVTEFLGLVILYHGFRLNVMPQPTAVPTAQTLPV